MASVILITPSFIHIPRIMAKSKKKRIEDIVNQHKHENQQLHFSGECAILSIAVSCRKNSRIPDNKSKNGNTKQLTEVIICNLTIPCPYILSDYSNKCLFHSHLHDGSQRTKALYHSIRPDLYRTK